MFLVFIFLAFTLKEVFLFFLIVIGVLVSVLFYYINYFSILFGKNETLPVEASIWLPQIIIFLICTLGLTKLNEN